MHPITLYFLEALKDHADPVRAPQMQAYAKTDQPFYGISAPVRKAIFKQAKKQHKQLNADDYRHVITQLWEGRSREEMYLALEVACGYKNHHNDSHFTFYESLYPRAANWDTLDWIASSLISPLVLANPSRESHLKQWRQDSNMWIRRASLLAHLRHREATNTQLLAETIDMLKHEREFFIRKAIGWVLRQYAKTNPTWVLDFVKTRETQLSGLTKREALKHLT